MTQTSSGSLKLKNDFLIALLNKGFRRLSFPAGIERDFAEYFYTQKFKPSYNYIWLGLGFFVAFLFLDYLTLKKHFMPILMVRLCIGAICAFILWLVHKMDRRFMAYLGSCLGIVLLNGGVTFVDVLGMREGVMSFPVGTLFVSLFVSSIIAIPFRYTAATLIVILSSYTFSMAQYTAIGDGVINMTILFVFIGLTGMISNYQREYEARRSFVQGLIIENNQRSIRTMLDNIPQGIFTVQEDLKISSWSKQLGMLFDGNDLANLDISRLASKYLKLTDLEKSHIRSVLMASFDQPDFSFMMNSDKLPNRTEALLRGQQKCLDLTWSPILIDGVIKEFLVTVKDVTDQIRYQKEKNQQDKELQLMGFLLTKDPKKLNIFFESASRFVADCLSCLKVEQDWSLAAINACFVYIHTLKGNAGTMGFSDIEEASHTIEDKLQSPQRIHLQQHIISELEDLDQLISGYLAIYQEKISHHDLNCVSISRQQVVDILSLLSTMKPQTFSCHIIADLESLVYTNLNSLIEDLVRPADKLARVLGKSFPQLELQGAQGIMIERGFEEVLRHVFLHLIRNSMDHGIESAEERLKKSKPASGRLQFEVQMDEKGQCQIDFSDDGRGLAVERLREKIQTQGNPSGIDLSDLRAVAASIFQPGMSTAAEVTTISGRGVGMDAVQSFLLKHGCNIDIRLAAVHDGYMPLRFRITLAPDCYHVSRAAQLARDFPQAAGY